MGSNMPKSLYIEGTTLDTLINSVVKLAPAASQVISSVKGTPAAPASVTYQTVQAADTTKKLFGIPVGFVVLIGGAAVVTGTIFLLKKKRKKRR
jgi:hypothetical protein